MNENNDLTQVNAPQKQEVKKALTKDEFISRVKNQMSQDFATIDFLLQNGKITQQEADGLKKQVDSVSSKLILEKFPQNTPQNNFDDVFSQLEKKYNSTSETLARQELKNYLKSNYATLDEKELENIFQLTDNIEKNAVENFKKQLEHEKLLKNKNEEAKSRLCTNIVDKTPESTLGSKVFTRDEIGNMSSEEFTQNEREIYSQLEKGLIK